MAAINSIGIKIIFTLILLTCCESMEWKKKTSVMVHECHSSRQLWARIIRNRESLRMTQTLAFSGWEVFVSPYDPFLLMFGIRRDASIYFIENQNGNLRLKVNQIPYGDVEMNETRLFRHQTRSHDNERVLELAASETFLTVDERGRAITTTDPERSLSVCL